MPIALLNGLIFTGLETVSGMALIIEDQRIHSLVDAHRVPKNATVINCEGCYIAPGLIDLQIYGGGGYLFSTTPTGQALTAMAEALVDSGTTSFLPTLATNAPEVFDEAIQTLCNHTHPAVLGLHFEGPYLNPLRKGAHPTRYIRQPDYKEIEELLKKAGGTLKMMTIAPELFDDATLGLLLQHGAVLSAGHSNASCDQAQAAFSKGVSTVTHLFNAMSPFHHRDPGLPGAVFETRGIYASIIADGIHVDDRAVRVSKKLLKERLFLITDAVEETQEGPYQHLNRGDRFTLADGTLSGSRLTLLQAVKRCVQQVGIPLDEALRMAAGYPARVMRLTDRGSLAPGYRADVIVFTPEFELKGVISNGKRCTGSLMQWKPDPKVQ